MEPKCLGDGANRAGAVKRLVAVHPVMRVYQGGDGGDKRNEMEKSGETVRAAVS